MACLTGLVTLTSTRIYDLHYSTCTRVPGSVSIHILRTVVLDYGELLAYWFILQAMVVMVDVGRWRRTSDRSAVGIVEIVYGSIFLFLRRSKTFFDI